MSTAKAAGGLPDLSSCEREPIHIPGSIQPHGVLLVLDPASGRICQASTNAPALLGQPMEAVLGRPLRELVQGGEMDSGESPPYHGDWQPVQFSARAQAPTQSWEACLHHYGSHALLELAPRADHFDDEPMRLVYELQRKLEGDSNVERAAARVAALVREQLGYDRVMVYRFDPQWNGEVVAEALKRDLEPYLGLNYPASDIPAQARALYLRNRVRGIPNIGYTPVALQPALNPLTDQPTDMSDISLRSVSPVHIEYLSNMGVAGTLVASVIVHGRLWGLISCHHYSPLYTDHEMRSFLDGVARGLAARVGAIEELAKITLETNLLTVREKLITALNENEHVTPELLGELAPELMDTVDADGVAIYHGQNISRYGQAPDLAALARIRDHIIAASEPANPQDMTGVLHTDALGLRFPALADLSDSAAGLIYMPLQYDTYNAVVWTRRERIHDVRWGGNPYLSKLQEIPGARLSPRQSFATWQETVRGHSRPWLAQHLESARSLRVLIELMERKHYQQNFNLMRATLERLQDSIVITSAHAGAWRDATVAFVNEAFIAETALDAEWVVGRPFHELLADPAAQSAALDALEAELRQGSTATVELLLRRQEGQPQRRQLQVEAVSDRHGAISHWLIVQRQAH